MEGGNKVRRVLCLCGGGIRGLVSLQVLKKMEQEFFPIYQTFDLIAGTSIGSALAVGLALGMTCEEIDQHFNRDNCKRIFPESWWDTVLDLVQTQPKYNGKGKTQVFKELFGDQWLGDVKTNVMVTAVDGESEDFKVFKSWWWKGDDTNKIKMPNQQQSCCHVVDCSSAAPGFFPAIKGPQGEWYVDGGLKANDPTICAISEARRLWGQDADIRVVTIGTGMPPVKRQKDMDQWGLVQWCTKQKLFDVWMNNADVRYLAKVQLGYNKYICANATLPSAVNHEMDDTSEQNMDALEKFGQQLANDFFPSICRILKPSP